MKKTKHTSNSLLFNELVDNGFDFLMQAVSEFDKKPKYSVVHFSTAVELILKARLVHDHWSLIVEGSPNIGKFKDGSFKSINFNELIPRIEGVTGERISPEIKACFDAIAKHRNKMVHFFHEADVKKNNKKIIKEIAIEQSAGWFYLRRLIEKWSPIFVEYDDKVSSLNMQMKNHRVFLSTVFEKIKPEIDLDKNRGSTYKTCFSCGFEASYKKPLTANLFECTCKVCLLKENTIEIKCPNCAKDIELDQEAAPDFECPECNERIAEHNLNHQLNTEPVTYDDYLDNVNINCAMCVSMDTVIKHETYFICKFCLAIENDMRVCDWCNEGQIGGGDLEFSYISGCEFCDGQAPHLKDD